MLEGETILDAKAERRRLGQLSESDVALAKQRARQLKEIQAKALIARAKQDTNEREDDLVRLQFQLEKLQADSYNTDTRAELKRLKKQQAYNYKRYSQREALSGKRAWWDQRQARGLWGSERTESHNLYASRSELSRRIAILEKGLEKVEAAYAETGILDAPALEGPDLSLLGKDLPEDTKRLMATFAKGLQTGQTGKNYVKIHVEFDVNLNDIDPSIIDNLASMKLATKHHRALSPVVATIPIPYAQSGLGRIIVLTRPGRIRTKYHITGTELDDFGGSTPDSTNYWQSTGNYRLHSISTFDPRDSDARIRFADTIWRKHDQQRLEGDAATLKFALDIVPFGRFVDDAWNDNMIWETWLDGAIDTAGLLRPS